MNDELIELAEKARENSYAPYSGYRVGAALRSCDGEVYCGCNIECASYSMTCCAERTAFFKAISEGVSDFIEIAVVGGKEDTESLCFPCGACLQVMSEFCNENFKVILKFGSQIKVFRLSELMPNSFSL